MIRHVKVVECRGWDFRVTQGALGGGMPKDFNKLKKARSVNNTSEEGRGWHRAFTESDRVMEAAMGS